MRPATCEHRDGRDGLLHRQVSGSIVAVIALAIGVADGERSEPDRERGA